MKKQIITLIASILFFSHLATAQFDIGLGFTGATKIKQAGFQLKGNFLPKGPFRTSADLTFYAGSSNTQNNIETNNKYWAINANEHFLIRGNDQLNLYPFAGFNLLFNKLVVDDRKTKNNSFGINLGVGGEYFIIANLVAFGEVTYVMSDTDRIGVSAGLAFKFGN